jgi:hypothetical protein
MVHDILVRPVDRLDFDQTVWVEDIRASPGVTAQTRRLRWRGSAYA